MKNCNPLWQTGHFCTRKRPNTKHLHPKNVLISESKLFSTCNDQQTSQIGFTYFIIGNAGDRNLQSPLTNCSRDIGVLFVSEKDQTLSICIQRRFLSQKARLLVHVMINKQLKLDLFCHSLMQADEKLQSPLTNCSRVVSQHASKLLVKRNDP